MAPKLRCEDSAFQASNTFYIFLRMPLYSYILAHNKSHYIRVRNICGIVLARWLQLRVSPMEHYLSDAFITYIWATFCGCCDKAGHLLPLNAIFENLWNHRSQPINAASICGIVLLRRRLRKKHCPGSLGACRVSAEHGLPLARNRTWNLSLHSPMLYPCSSGAAWMSVVIVAAHSCWCR